MNITVKKENRNIRKGNPDQKSEVLYNNDLMLEENRKYDMLRQLRIKLGKSKEEFHKIFELYNHLLNQQNP